MWRQPLERIRRFFQPRPVWRLGQQLYAACVAQARQPTFYADHGVEDAIGARFELLTLHVVAVIAALRSADGADEMARELSQAVFDSYLEALDNTLREQGVGDLTVPKKMKQLGAVIYTRMRRWDELWAESGSEAQADYLLRTVYAATAYDEETGEEPDADAESDASATGDVAFQSLPHAQWLADYLTAVRSGLEITTLKSGRVTWPELTANMTPEAAHV